MDVTVSSSVLCLSLSADGWWWLTGPVDLGDSLSTGCTWSLDLQQQTARSAEEAHLGGGTSRQRACPCLWCQTLHHQVNTYPGVSHGWAQCSCNAACSTAAAHCLWLPACRQPCCSAQLTHGLTWSLFCLAAPEQSAFGQLSLQNGGHSSGGGVGGDKSSTKRPASPMLCAALYSWAWELLLTR